MSESNDAKPCMIIGVRFSKVGKIYHFECNTPGGVENR